MSNQIFELIPKIMNDVGAVEKNRKNSQGTGYQFRGIDDVLNALSSPLSSHGVFVVPEVLNMVREERQSKSGGNLIYTILDVKFTFFAPDGSSVVAITKGEAMDSGDKSCNKAMSAAMKYALIQTFSIPTIDEKDTEIETHETKPKNEKPKESVKSKQRVPEILHPAEQLIGFGKEPNRKFKDVDDRDLQRLLDWVESNNVQTPAATKFKDNFNKYIHYQLDRDQRIPS